MPTVDTPAGGRRPAIDVARVGALLMVVLGHLALATIDRDTDGALRGTNLLELRPGWLWLTLFAPMPVFFAAAGWAHMASTPQHAAARLRPLVGISAVVVTLWSVASVAEMAVAGHGGIVADGARIATQPLWFLAAYVPFAALGTRLTRVAHRIVRAVAVCLAALAIIDIARFAFDGPRWIGWPGFFIAWCVPWLLGAWWRTAVPRSAERRLGALLTVSASAVAIALVWRAGYSPSLIDAVPGRRSNTTPPTLFTAVVATGQVGVLMLMAESLDRVGRRWRLLVERAGSASIGVYVWHLTALSICAATLALGVWAPTRLSPEWWLTRPLWFLLVLSVTAGLTALTVRSHHPTRRSTPTPTRAALAIISVTLGAALIGVYGPREVPIAVATTVAFVGGWLVLRVGSTDTPDRVSAPE